jgi:hypothetical protein
MPRSSRFFAVLLLILLAVPVTLQAAEPRRDAGPISTAGGTWGLLAQVWDLLTGVQTDNGCRIEPSGLCLPNASATPTADNGCRLDPNGLCLPGASAIPTPDNGCRIEPNGLCRN